SGLAQRYLTERNWGIVARLQDFCARSGHGLIDLAFSWLLAQPTLASVIAGATRPEQLEQNVKAAGWKLTPEELAEVDRLPRDAGGLASFGLDIGGADHLAPLLGLLGQGPAVLAGRQRQRRAAEIGEARFDLGIGKRRVDLAIEPVDDFGRHVFGRANPQHI